ncbi:hypothetical protein K490DRAFT_63014 [Saccharata proteae CBS 121410]|uniref:MJ1316 RNA cyclic group end recognition domain-containing protein n=1 Tax=Saccharata proteae CBS 121410 TaxID=1314787 RepID=A0A9P4HVX5_9PEZI|nr:hypothetical protein K490DRAFT_63014 [Saccharata proteae CBS 121410]
MAASRAAQSPSPAPDLADSQSFLDAYGHYLAVTLHSPASSTIVPEAFLAWLDCCCHALCNEIYAAMLPVLVHPHPAIFAPSPSLANPLRYLIGVSAAHPSDPDLTARLTCGLQAFLSQLRQHSTLLAPKALGGSGLWLNARYLARSDLTLAVGTSASEHTSIALSPRPITLPTSQQTPSPSQPLPPSALAAIRSSLLIVDEPDPSATPTLSADATRPSARARTCIPPSSSNSSSSSSAAVKLRPASDVLARLRWDQALGGPDAYVVGYWDRFVGVVEIGAGKWERESTNEEWVPMHRVEYVRRAEGEGGDGGGGGGEKGAEAGSGKWNGDDGLVWHRGRRIDRIFGSGVKHDPATEAKNETA